jgi:hypothetical protein
MNGMVKSKSGQPIPAEMVKRRNDNRLQNLRFLCPNCHTQTETWCSKNKILL